jgi:predicted DCC family thiol-disulfide oxidoreductase YuxK
MNITHTVVFDGTCRVCTRLAAALQRWGRGQIEVIASQSPGVPERFPWIPPAAYAEALQLIGPGGETWQGSAAVEQLIRILPRGRLIVWAYQVPLVRTVADRFYRWFARNRYHFGCTDHCAPRARPD